MNEIRVRFEVTFLMPVGDVSKSPKEIAAQCALRFFGLAHCAFPPYWFDIDFVSICITRAVFLQGSRGMRVVMRELAICLSAFQEPQTTACPATAQFVQLDTNSLTICWALTFARALAPPPSKSVVADRGGICSESGDHHFGDYGGSTNFERAEPAIQD